MKALARRQICSVSLVLTLMFASSALAADQQAAALGDSAINSLTPEVGPVRNAQSLIGKTVTSREGIVVGTIEDLVLDIDTGHLALVLISPREYDDGEKVAERLIEWRIAAPGTLVKVKDQTASASEIARDQFDKARHVPRDSTDLVFSRPLANAIHDDYGTIPPWENPNVEVDSTSPLTPLSTLKKQPVTGADGEMLGHIEDFVIATNSARIAYAAVSTDTSLGKDDRELYPIPLGSFVVIPGTENWILEITEEALTDTPSFNSRHWPTEIERGWVEYIHTRYGSGFFHGVQRHQSPD